MLPKWSKISAVIYKVKRLDDFAGFVWLKNKISLSRTLTATILRPFLESSRSQKNIFSRALTKRLTAILRPFLESSRSQKKKFSRTLTKRLTATLRPFLESSRSQKNNFL